MNSLSGRAAETRAASFGTSAKDVHAAWWATGVVFLIHGLVVATWVSRIPAIKTALGLDNAVLGVTLLGGAIGAICATPVSARLLHRFGSKNVTAFASVAFCCILLLPALAWSTATLAAALFAFGATGAVMDISMNAQGVEVEKRLGHPTMSRFHAMFSLGGMLGAALGGVVAARRIRPASHFAISALAYVCVISVVARLLLRTPRLRALEQKLRLRRLPRALIALSAIAFCIFLSEGAMADWTALYLRQALNAGAGIAAAGYSVFSAGMAVFRLLGDLITSRLGPVMTVRTGALVAALGMTWALSAQSPGWAMPGFVATGAGLSVIVPLVFGGSGRVEPISPGAGIATVTGIGYIGFIAGPPAIGFASQVFTLRFALGLVVICCLVTSILSGFVGGRQQPSVQ